MNVKTEFPALPSCQSESQGLQWVEVRWLKDDNLLHLSDWSDGHGLTLRALTIDYIHANSL